MKMILAHEVIWGNENEAGAQAEAEAEGKWRYRGQLWSSSGSRHLGTLGSLGLP